MKFLVLLFGACGFGLVCVTGLAADRQPDLVLRDAALGCLGLALVGRWFAGRIEEAFAQTLAARREQQRLAEEKAAVQTPSPATREPAAATPHGALPAPLAARAR